MLTRLSLVAAIAALGPLAGVSAGAAADEPLRLAQANDIRQQDRRADRQMDPADERAEVRVPLPRNADGTIDIPALLGSISARVGAGAREIQIRNDSLTQEEARALLLAVDANQNLLARIGAALPNDGVERNVTFRGAVDARVQREPDGTLRLRVRDINIGGLTDAQRAQLAMNLGKTAGFDRVRIEGVDAQGNRIRIEFRADKGLTRNEARVDRRGGQVAGDDQREGRQSRDGRAERSGRSERADRVERVDRSGSSERVERVERVDRSGSNSGRN